MIREALAGKRIGVTGATGFLGTALVERLLRSVPECEVVVLVRPGRRTNAETRVHREILRNDAFDKLRTMVDDLVASGGVNPGKAFLLTNRLDRAAADGAAGRHDAFRAQMQAFGNQVAGLSPRWITPTAAAQLQAQAAAAEEG